MSKKLTITLEDDGTAYRGKKLIATVKDGVIKFKHYSYKKHQQETEMLMAQDEPVADIGLEPIAVPVPEKIEKVVADLNGQPITPKHLFRSESGIFYGELAPEVVEWRKKHWSDEEYNSKYNTQEALLSEVFEKHNKIYVRNNNIGG